MFSKYLSFVDTVPDASLLYIGRYEAGFVLLSISINIFAAYTALLVTQFAERAEEKETRFILLSLGGIVLGVGIWSMHFIGMLGFQLPCGVNYDPLIMIFSMIPGIIMSSRIKSGWFFSTMVRASSSFDAIIIW
jgi:two-component system sensor histidine kinase/response regulator